MPDFSFSTFASNQKANINHKFMTLNLILKKLKIRQVTNGYSK